MLNYERMYELEINLKHELDEHLTEHLIRLDRNNRLDEFLDILDLSHLLSDKRLTTNNKYGKIIVCGDCGVPLNVLYGIGKTYGISKERFEFCLDYNDAAYYDFDSIQYNTNYALIIVGKMPHSGPAKKEYNSVIHRIESDEGFPPVIRAGLNELKLTKSSFKSALEQALNNNVIIPNLN